MIIILINLIGCWWLAVSSAQAGEIGGQRNGNSSGHSNHPTMSGASQLPDILSLCPAGDGDMVVGGGSDLVDRYVVIFERICT